MEKDCKATREGITLEEFIRKDGTGWEAMKRIERIRRERGAERTEERISNQS